MNTKPGLLTIVELGSYLGKAKKLLPEEELEAVKLLSPLHACQLSALMR